MDAANVSLTVPPAIESVIAKFDAADTAFDVHDVSRELVAARQSLTSPSEAENTGAWSEVLAFSLTHDAANFSPWGTYFGPTGSMEKDDGTTIYFPDIAGTPAAVVQHWINRANTVQHPVLSARYADLAWEMSRAIANVNPDHRMARIAIEAYLTCLSDTRRDIHDHFQCVTRALDLAETLRDPGRIETARKSLLQLHASVVAAANSGLWWKTFDRLIGDRNAGLTAQEEAQLVADMEATLARVSDSSNPQAFDPNSTKDAADRLIRYYNAAKKTEEAARLSKVVAGSFEFAASLADPMLAPAFLQTAVTAYRDAGLPEEGRRARGLMEEKIEASHAHAKTHAFEMKISKDDMDKFLDAVVKGNIGSTFGRIAYAFLTREQLEAQVEQQLKDSPLSAMITQTILHQKHVAAVVGSVQDDPVGRVIQHATRLIP